MSKIIFIDVDGTLCDATGQVPDSARQAVQQARSNGHFVFLCTGRSLPEITPDILGIGFDGLIGAGGGYIEIQGETMLHQCLPATAVRDVLAYFDHHQIGYYLESNDGLFASANCVASITSQSTAYIEREGLADTLAPSDFQWFFDLLKSSQDPEFDEERVNKLSFISNGHPYQAVYEKFQQSFAFHRTTVPAFGPESGEISPKGIDKATAIQTVLKHLGHTQGETLAYGDGDNDLAMFAAVAHRVAMANATPSLQAAADELTARAEEDGLYASFQRNHLI